MGVDGTTISYNLFAYCKNNPIVGHDPSGTWDWGGVIAGLTLIVAGVVAIATLPITAPVVVTSAIVVTTGIVTTQAAATDSAMVLDLSYSSQISPDTYTKAGVSVVIDFGQDTAYAYPHVGVGKGRSSGISYSVGRVANYEDPYDYAEWFVDVNAGLNMGMDHCWDPRVDHGTATKATAITFGSGLNAGIGIDWYFAPIALRE